VTFQGGTLVKSIKTSPTDQPWDQLPYACPDVMGAQLANPLSTAAMYRSQEYGGRMVKTHHQAIWPGIYDFDTLNGCFPEPGSQGFLPVRLFGVEGLGGDYYRDTFPFSSHSLERYPVWFRKGNESWGTPWDFDDLLIGLSNGDEGNDLRIFPLPLEAVAWVEHAAEKEEARLEFRDIQGIRVLELPLNNSGRTLLQRADFPGAGIYFWSLTESGGRGVLRGKILVK